VPGALFGPGYYAFRGGDHHRGSAGLSGSRHSTPDADLGKHVGRFVNLAGTALVAGVFPGLAITVTVLAFNLFGDGIRDTLDPHLKGSHGSGG
jgi:hypothetical protein